MEIGIASLTMRIHKAEVFFFLLICFIGLGGAFAWAAFSAATNGYIVGGIQSAVRFSFMSGVLAALSVICGLFLIFPIMSRGLHERGRLEKMTQSLTLQSLTLEHAAVTDALTGLHNRRYFNEALNEYMNAFRKVGKPIGLAILDLDYFKKINDTHGHDIGDEVLRQVANCLQEFTRYHDVVARQGGEEFVILSPNITERQLHNLADRIRQAISKLQIQNGNIILKVTASIGVTIWNGEESSEDLYRRADKQLYVAKSLGRNRVCAA